jgi:glycosyltransferase involved in cell wall biosynthesis
MIRRNVATFTVPDVGPAARPRDAWHSFDRTPWRHPWLTSENLAEMRAFSQGAYAWAHKEAEGADPASMRFGFVGNLANSLYARGVVLRRMGLHVDTILHPHDHYIMSQPGWEEYDGTVPPGVSSMADLAEAGITLPDVPHAHIHGLRPDWYLGPREALPEFVRNQDLDRLMSFMPYLETLEALQVYDACLTSQAPYLVWMARRPYLVTQNGADIWYECARDDLFGRVQRQAFAEGAAFLVSNPWSFAHARRYGMRHMIYVPVMLDETVYRPGASSLRQEWQRATGGTFFVLSTARVDEFYKGSGIGLRGFAEFSRNHSEARLVFIGWGEDEATQRARLTELGIADRVLVLPISGKRRLVQYLQAADCLLDQFTLGYYGSTALEAMACGLPVIMRIEAEQYEGLCPAGAPPVLQAASPEEVFAHLLALGQSVSLRLELGIQCRNWFLASHSGARWAGVYSDLLAATALGKCFDFSASPLGRPLSVEENRYHAAELACAPLFPNYR